MTKCIRTDSNNTDFIALVKELDKELAIRDGSEHSFYAQYNSISSIKNAVVAYYDNVPAGCGAFKEYEPGIAEIKRMYTPLNMRKKGIASAVLIELEAWAKENGFSKCILETGVKQPEAIALYKKCGYILIPNYSQYIGIGNSRCFEKLL